MWSPVTDLTAFIAYGVAMSLSPGPTNAMLATLGVRSGLRRSLPAVAGVSVALFILLAVAGSGIGAILQAAPAIKSALTLAGVAYMSHLAWAFWRKHPDKKSGEAGPLMGFWGALVLQLTNPKGLLTALAACSFLGPAAGAKETLTMAGIFMVVAFPCCAVWAFMGDRLSHWLSRPGRALMFSRAMSVLLAVTALSLLKEI